jgi:DNA-binding MurR/RpiR family transcriptional regulator
MMRHSIDRPGKTRTPAASRPDSYDSLKQAITDHYAGLSRRLQEVAEYALGNPDEMALETIAVIAARARVPPSSLIRFAKALGFEGFTEMQRLFRARLVAHAPTYGERIKRLHDRQERTGATMPSAILDDFAKAGIEGLERLRQDLPAARLQRAIEMLALAPMVHVIGQRRAFPVACYLAYLLRELGCAATLLDGAGGMLEQQTRLLGRDDSTLLVVSFRPYSPEVMDLVERGHEAGVPIIGITDGPLSPLARLAEVSLEVVESEVQDFRPLSAAMCLALTITVALGHHLAATSD